MVVTELSSPSSITIGSEKFFNLDKLLRSFVIVCIALESMTNFRVTAARAQSVSQMRWQSLVIARAAVAVAFFTFHHSIIRL